MGTANVCVGVSVKVRNDVGVKYISEICITVLVLKL